MPGSSASVAARIRARLSAAGIAADVDALRDGTVHVQVDADAAALVDSLLHWRGGIRAYVMEGPKPTAGVDRHTTIPERLPSGERRAHAVRIPAVAEMTVDDGSIRSVGLALHGRGLAIDLSNGARAAIADQVASEPELQIAFVRDRTWLGSVPTRQALASPVILPLGDDLGAFTRAVESRRLIDTPDLPPLTRMNVARVAPRWGLAAASALVPFFVSLAWLGFVRRFDRARPEPAWLVLATFALGGLAAAVALGTQAALAASTPWLDPSLVTLGGQLWSLPIAVPVFVLVIGASEEGAKLLATWSLARHRSEFDEPIDGIVYGCAAALGFAAVENVKFFAIGRMSGALLAIRAFVTVPSHMFLASFWGYALGMQLVSRRARLAWWFALAVVAHGLFDALLSVDATRPYAPFFVIPLGVGFFALLRRSLRHGAVRPRAWSGAPRTELVPPSALDRAYFSVGSLATFAACATVMIGLALELMILGVGFETLRHRVGAAFVGYATALLAAFGAAAYAATATMPLDVAVDAQGVTFGGARTPWALVFGVDLQLRRWRSAVVVRTANGDLRLGPVTSRTARALARTIDAARGDLATTLSRTADAMP
jgi:RsiW-degrading membrane proteinase PrsW (M82 family)